MGAWPGGVGLGGPASAIWRLSSVDPTETAMKNALAIEQWVDRCAARLTALNPESPLAGTDWDDIASDLWEQDASAEPEAAAETWQRYAIG